MEKTEFLSSYSPLKIGQLLECLDNITINTCIWLSDDGLQEHSCSPIQYIYIIDEEINRKKLILSNKAQISKCTSCKVTKLKSSDDILTVGDIAFLLPSLAKDTEVYLNNNDTLTSCHSIQFKQNIEQCTCMKYVILSDKQCMVQYKLDKDNS